MIWNRCRRRVKMRGLLTECFGHCLFSLWIDICPIHHPKHLHKTKESSTSSKPVIQTVLLMTDLEKKTKKKSNVWKEICYCWISVNVGVLPTWSETPTGTSHRNRTLLELTENVVFFWITAARKRRPSKHDSLNRHTLNINYERRKPVWICRPWCFITREGMWYLRVHSVTWRTG